MRLRARRQTRGPYLTQIREGGLVTPPGRTRPQVLVPAPGGEGGGDLPLGLQETPTTVGDRRDEGGGPGAVRGVGVTCVDLRAGPRAVDHVTVDGGQRGCFLWPTLSHSLASIASGPVSQFPGSPFVDQVNGLFPDGLGQSVTPVPPAPYPVSGTPGPQGGPPLPLSVPR